MLQFRVTDANNCNVQCKSLVKRLRTLSLTSIEGKSSVCVICMKYRIIILLSYIANTTHAHTVVTVQVVAVQWVGSAQP